MSAYSVSGLSGLAGLPALRTAGRSNCPVGVEGASKVANTVCNYASVRPSTTPFQVSRWLAGFTTGGGYQGTV